MPSTLRSPLRVVSSPPFPGSLVEVETESLLLRANDSKRWKGAAVVSVWHIDDTNSAAMTAHCTLHITHCPLQRHFHALSRFFAGPCRWALIIHQLLCCIVSSAWQWHQSRPLSSHRASPVVPYKSLHSPASSSTYSPTNSAVSLAFCLTNWPASSILSLARAMARL